MFKKFNKMGLAVIGTLLGLVPANAAVIMTFTESAGNVELATAGSVVTTSLVLSETGNVGPQVAGVGALAISGAYASPYGSYTGISGPTSFGSGGNFGANTTSGDIVGVLGGGSRLFLPTGYSSGAPLSGAAGWLGTTFATLGLTPGSYVYTWGSGPTADSLTVNIGAQVPEPSAALLGSLGLIAYFRRKRWS